MPEKLLESQFDALEEPLDEPDTVVVDIDRSIDDIVELACVGLRDLSELGWSLAVPPPSPELQTVRSYLNWMPWRLSEMR